MAIPAGDVSRGFYMYSKIQELGTYRIGGALQDLQRDHLGSWLRG